MKFSYETLPYTEQTDEINCGVFVCSFYEHLLSKKVLEIECIQTARQNFYNHLISNS